MNCDQCNELEKTDGLTPQCKTEDGANSCEYKHLRDALSPWSLECYQFYTCLNTRLVYDLQLAQFVFELFDFKLTRAQAFDLFTNLVSIHAVVKNKEAQITAGK